MELKEIQPEYPKIDDKKTIHTTEVFGKFKIISTVPTGTPANWDSQILLYINGTTYRLYIYDYSNGVWHYVTLTA